MNRLNTFDWISLVLLIIGGINWGLIGIFRVDAIAFLFGDMTIVSRVLYSLVGIGAIYAIATSVKLGSHGTSFTHTEQHA